VEKVRIVVKHGIVTDVKTDVPMTIQLIDQGQEGLRGYRWVSIPENLQRLPRRYWR